MEQTTYRGAMNYRGRKTLILSELHPAVDRTTLSRSKQSEHPFNQMDDKNGDRKRPNVKSAPSTLDLARGEPRKAALR
jgi:hypothetical protein